MLLYLLKDEERFIGISVVYLTPSMRESRLSCLDLDIEDVEDIKSLLMRINGKTITLFYVKSLEEALTAFEKAMPKFSSKIK